MKLTINSPVYTKKGKKNVWVAPGTYQIVRWFDQKKVIINVSSSPEASRQLTIVPASVGTLS